MDTLDLNKKSFTLIEMLISVSILVLIFSFLYGQFNLAQLSTKKTTQIESSSSKREKIINLLYNDFVTSYDIQSTSGKKFDRFIKPFKTSNSLYGTTEPYVRYLVVYDNDIKRLIRLEGFEDSLNINSARSEYYMENVLDDIEYFKVLVSDDFIEFYIKSKNIKDIYFKFNRVVAKI